MSVEPDWFISVGVWPLACITPVGRGWQVPKQPPFLLLDGDFPPEPCGTQRICLAESEVEHQGNAFLFCLALILAGDLSIKSHLSLQVCAAPNPQCSSLHLTPALFSESGSAVEMFTVPKVLGRQTPAFKHCCRACLEAQAMKALKDSGTPESEWEGGNQKLHFLILSRPAHIAVADAPLLCSMVEFPFCCFIFISSPGYNEAGMIWVVSCQQAASQLQWMCCALASVSWYWRSNWNGLLGWYPDPDHKALFWCWQEQWTTVNRW